MTDRYTPERIARLAEVLGAFVKIEDRDLEWMVGTIAVWKSSRLLFRPMNVPTYRRGYVFELPEDMRFETVPFTRTGGQPAVAMLLRSPKEEFLAGWVDAAQAELANRAVSFLNSELEAAWAYHRQLLARASDDMSDDVVEKERWLVFEQGSEYAPDAPWGYQQLRISTLGRLEYEHRNRGRNTFMRAWVDAERCGRLFDALQSTSFPAPPQESFVPGASVLVISTNASPSGRVLIDYFDGLEMDGYRDVIGDLSDLNTALRTNDAAKLAEWAFRPSDAGKETTR
jgi:hypothetical protein